MKRTVAWSILAILGQFGSMSRAQSRSDIARQFAGMWRLVANPQRLADGTTRQGSNNLAYVMFDNDAGHMCYIGMNSNRPRWKSEIAPTPEEELSAMRGFGAYCATVEIHAKEGFIVRKYEIDKNPNAAGRSTKRWYTFQGTNRMSLRIDTSELKAPVVEATLIWERVGKIASRSSAARPPDLIDGTIIAGFARVNGDCHRQDSLRLGELSGFALLKSRRLELGVSVYCQPFDGRLRSSICTLAPPSASGCDPLPGTLSTLA